MPETDLELLTEAVRYAGEIALRYFRFDLEVWEKSDGAGPVTEADLAVDKALRKQLMAARRDYGWLSEETGDSPERLSRRHVFILDPIDGTRAFMRGHRDWGISLAVATDREITAAAAFFPARDELYTAALGEGAKLNGVPITCSAKSDLDEATVLAAKVNFEPRFWKDETLPNLRRKFRSSLALRLCLVGSGRFDAMLTLRPCWEWDIAAGSLIVRESGGLVTNSKGSELRFNNPEAKLAGVVAGGALQLEILSQLA